MIKIKDKRYLYTTAALTGSCPLKFVSLSDPIELESGSFSWTVKTVSGNIYRERECNLTNFCI